MLPKLKEKKKKPLHIPIVWTFNAPGQLLQQAPPKVIHNINVPDLVIPNFISEAIRRDAISIAALSNKILAKNAELTKLISDAANDKMPKSIADKYAKHLKTFTAGPMFDALKAATLLDFATFQSETEAKLADMVTKLVQTPIKLLEEIRKFCGAECFRPLISFLTTNVLPEIAPGPPPAEEPAAVLKTVLETTLENTKQFILANWAVTASQKEDKKLKEIVIQAIEVEAAPAVIITAENYMDVIANLQAHATETNKRLALLIAAPPPTTPPATPPKKSKKSKKKKPKPPAAAAIDVMTPPSSPSPKKGRGSRNNNPNPVKKGKAKKGLANQSKSPKKGKKSVKFAEIK